MSSEGENPKSKSIRKRRCSELKHVEPTAEKKEPKVEKLIQAETSETGRVRRQDSPPSLGWGGRGVGGGVGHYHTRTRKGVSEESRGSEPEAQSINPCKFSLLPGGSIIGFCKSWIWMNMRVKRRVQTGQIELTFFRLSLVNQSGLPSVRLFGCLSSPLALTAPHQL